MFKRWLTAAMLSLSAVLFLSCGIGAEEITIIRDDYGVPHIYAKSDEALMFGQGYAMACDRLFQMEMFKMSASGKLAKYMGEKYVEYDKASRSYFMNDEAVIRFSRNLPQQQGRLFAAFIAGVNLRIKEVTADPGGKLPKEFAEAGVEPAEWTVEDLVKIIMHRNHYVFDSNEELLNASLLAKLKDKYGSIDGQLIFDEIIPINDVMASAQASFMPGASGLAAAAAKTRAEAELARRRSEELAVPYGIGSYAVAISSRKTTTGNSMMLAGPQMGFTNPSVYYECGLHGDNIQAYGIQTVGIPGLSIGQNGDGAWTMTGGLDNQLDYFIEHINPKNHQQYWFRSKWVDMKKDDFIIDVKDGKSQVHTIYRTVHGPVVHTDLSDEKNPVAYTKAVSVGDADFLESWNILFNALKVKNCDEFLSAVTDYPLSANFFYIGRWGEPYYIHTGKYPVRAENVDPRLPTDGRGDSEWQGMRPVKELPVSKSPVRGYFADWNSKPSTHWTNGERANYWGAQNRVDHVLSYMGLFGEDKISFRDLDRIDERFSDADIYACEIKPLILETVKDSQDEDVKLGAEMLKVWDNTYSDKDGDGYYDAPGIPVFYYFMSALSSDVFPDLSGDLYTYVCNAYGAPLMYKFLRQDGSYKMGYDFARGRSVNEIAHACLKSAVATLKEKHGADPSTWRDRVAYDSFASSMRDSTHVSLGREDLEKFPATKRATGIFMWEAARNWVKGVGVLPPGVGSSGEKDYLDGHNTDQLPLFKTRKYKTMLFYPEDVLHHEEKVQKLHYDVKIPQ